MGLCTACGKQVTGEHACNDDYVLLGTTDWKVLRHLDQLNAGIDTSLTAVEFQALLAERQAARARISQEA